MELKENLLERIRILEQAGLIQESVAESCRDIIALLLQEEKGLDEEKCGMFITHLAMALQRIIKGEKEKAMDEQILEEIKAEEVYPKVEIFAEKLIMLCRMEFPRAEEDYLKVHLCNLFL